MILSHEKILKRPNGNKVKLIASFNYSYQKIIYTVDVLICDSGKRNWRKCIDTNCFQYRQLTLDEQSIFEQQEIMKIVSKEELHEVKLELWENMKPAID